jgi:ABC-type transport system involved in multi-copper enzyme maturation permease subunit
MLRLFTIIRHNFKQAVLQPVYGLLLLFGLAVIAIFTYLPFFTLGEDTRMFKAVCMDLILLLVLISTLLATSKSIFEEIEDRTMLTLMSKPIGRWQVLLGKYLGIVFAAGLAILVLFLALWVAVNYRVPGDYMLRTKSLFAEDLKVLADNQNMHAAGLIPGALLMWLQVSVLAAISVAISTRVSFVVNLPAVILIYLAGNMTRFIDAAVSQAGGLFKGIGFVLESILPFLSVFDQRQYTVYSTVRLAGTQFANEPNGVYFSQMMTTTGTAALYALFYIAAALLVGLISFQSRELGGNEG